MPYSKIEELPEGVKALPKHGQEIFMAAFNSAFEQYSKSPSPSTGEGGGEGDLEGRCFATAWAAVKNKYKKEGDKWIPINMSEFPEWIEIFETGTWTSKEGITREWTDSDLDEIATLYNPQKFIAPFVIGHPEDDSPAYGWVEALKREGHKLLAKGRDVVDEFKDAVKKGLYRKVSMAVYPDMTLKHVGFLGAKSPALKGLKPVSFGDKKAGWTFEMEISCLESVERQNFTDTINKGGKKMDLKKFFSDLKELVVGAEKDLAPPDPGGVKFTEADVQARTKEAQTLAFAEAQKKIDAEAALRTEAEKKLKEIETKARKEAIHVFCEGLAKEGKIIPAWQKMGIEEFIFNLESSQSIKFAEGHEKPKSQWFMDFLKEIPKVVEFSEIAGKDKNTPPGDFDKAVEAVMAEKKISRAKAIEFCAREYPDLHDEYVTNLKK